MLFPPSLFLSSFSLLVAPAGSLHLPVRNHHRAHLLCSHQIKVRKNYPTRTTAQSRASTKSQPIRTYISCCFLLHRRSSQLSFCDCLCSELREIAPPPSSCSRAGDQSSSASSSSPSPPLQQRANGGGGGDDTSPNLLFRQTRALLTRGPGSSEEGGNSSEENSQL